MFGPFYFGLRYFGARFWGVGETIFGRYFGPGYFARRYFGPRYWGTGGPVGGTFPHYELITTVQVATVTVDPSLTTVRDL